eukprot:190015_1
MACLSPPPIDTDTSQRSAPVVPIPETIATIDGTTHSESGKTLTQPPLKKRKVEEPSPPSTPSVQSEGTIGKDETDDTAKVVEDDKAIEQDTKEEADETEAVAIDTVKDVEPESVDQKDVNVSTKDKEEGQKKDD